ncbi:MAG: AAA family ATPase [Candidatus Diapherotrites archaeon]|uniref:ORC1-type DNA replication protein n=1 Tax=Candidatus Iainarchaeum sp. TaxID=3101447 RepID=A0A8T4KUD0_9ARCH|nr:AAA family ATPase [Candidatus Diapherotrites archaeon]
MPRNIFENAALEGAIFKNESYLYPEFVPERLPHREEQIDALVYCFAPIAKGAKPHNVFVHGKTGTGKTVTVKYVMNELQEHTDRAKALYINCFEFSSRSSVLSEVANFIGAVVPRRGLSTDEVYSKLLESAKRLQFTPIIILDEADQLSVQGKEDASKLLYDLLRIIEYEKIRFGIALISNSQDFLAKLDSRVRSSLAEERIEFEPYSPIQLKEILRERTEFAFLPNALENEVINVAAAHAAKLGGDCRIAIESLWKAGRLAEKESAGKITLKHLRSAFELIESSPGRKPANFLSETEKGLLEIILREKEINSGVLFLKYNEAAKEKLSERRLREVASNLEKKQIISSERTNLPERGRTRKISLKISQSALAEKLGKQI